VSTPLVIDPHALPEAPGWFGKMPALGDFASRRLPGDWIAGWDEWLQRELVRSRAELGDDAWLSLYLVAPVRRFWLAPGLLAGCAWLGVLMPSVDSVGRHFPFTLAVPLPSGHDDVVDALANSNWLDAADETARQVLDPAFDVGALEQSLLDMPALHGERRGEAHAGSTLAEQLHAAGTPLRSAWWCEGAERVEQYVIAGALPTGAVFDALLRDGAQGD
jgi:type VI secretion system protein ImpM